MLWGTVRQRHTQKEWRRHRTIPRECSNRSAGDLPSRPQWLRKSNSIATTCLSYKIGVVGSAVNRAASNPTKCSNSSLSRLDDARSNMDHFWWGRLDNFSPKFVLVFRGFEVFKTHLPSLIAGILKEFIAGGVRHVRALCGETAVKGQGLSGVIR